MAQGRSIEDSFRSDPLLRLTNLVARLSSSQRARVISSYNLDLPAKIEYIYCVKLPFACTRSIPQREAGGPFRIPHRHRVHQSRRPYYLSPRPPRSAPPQLRAPTPEWTPPNQVVKIGRSEKPARRFQEILGAFQKLGIDVPSLQEADDPQTTIDDAKKYDFVVFLVKVRDIGTAEEDIRKLLGKSLGQHFIDNFRKCLSEDQNKRFDDAGMTEWVLMDNKQVTDLQGKFRFGQLFSHGSPYLPDIPPSGGQIYQRLLCSEALKYFVPRSRQPPHRLHEILITLPKIAFNYKLNIQQ